MSSLELAQVQTVDLFSASTEGKNFRAEELEIPRLQIIRPNSRQLKKGEADYNKQAKQGMFFNSVTKELYDPDESDIVFIPVSIKQIVALTTKPLSPDAPGDYVTSVQADSVQFQYDKTIGKSVVLAGAQITVSDTQVSPVGLIADVRDSISAVIVYKSRVQPVILTLKGKSRQVTGKKLKSMISMQKEAIFAHAYKLGATFVMGSKGDILVEDFTYISPTRELPQEILEDVKSLIGFLR